METYTPETDYSRLTLLACRMASVAEIKQKVLSKRGRSVAIKDNLLAKEVIVGDGEWVLETNDDTILRQSSPASLTV